MLFIGAALFSAIALPQMPVAFWTFAATAALSLALATLSALTYVALVLPVTRR